MKFAFFDEKNKETSHTIAFFTFFLITFAKSIY